MTEYNGKKILNLNISDGNPYREEYLNSINRFIEKRQQECKIKRDEFISGITENQEEYRKKYLEMIGQPISPYPDYTPNVKSEYVGKDDFCDIYHLQIETMPDFWFYGILMVPKNAKKAPLVIAQHGGGGTPELCSDFIGENNYNFFTKKALEKGMVVFAPQLLLWKFNIDTGEKFPSIDIPFDRGKLNNKLLQTNLSITGIEVFNIRRSIDYLTSLEYIDENRIGMMGLSYGGYFSLYTAAADTRIKSIYSAASFNDGTKICFFDWTYKDSANNFSDAEVCALCAPRKLQIDVGTCDHVFDYSPSIEEGKRAEKYYNNFNASRNFCYNLWEGGHFFDKSEKGFEFFFNGI